MNKKLQRLSGGLLAACVLAASGTAAMAAPIEGHWAQSTLEAFIASGYEDPAADPDSAMTQAEFAALLSRVTGQDVEGSSQEAITRQDACAMVAHLLGLAGLEADLTYLKQFSDSGNISADARADVAEMVKAGYIHGTDRGTFLPNQALTRAEGATIVNNALGALLALGSETVYGTAALTFAEYYAGDVSSVDGYGIDGVSSATTSKHSIMSNMSTDFQDVETNADGYHILGIQNVNVAVDAADYQAYVAINPTFRATGTVPSQYKRVSIVDGKAVYSATKFNVADTVTDAAAALKTGSVWGDYEIDVTEASTQHLRNSREDTFDVNSGIQGVILETADGLKVGMEYLQSIWVQPYEVSFNVSADSAYNAHIASWDNLPELSKLVGASITSITYIMQDSAYVYEFDGIYIKPVYSGAAQVAAAFTAGSAEVAITGVPADLEDVAVTVTCGSGRNSVTLASAAAITDGKITMDSAYDDTQTYTVKVSSSNYADLVAAVPVNSTQAAQIAALAEQAKALIDSGAAAQDSGLIEHYEEALALLSDVDGATSAQAADLISELTEHLSVYVPADTGAGASGTESSHGGSGGSSGYQH